MEKTVCKRVRTVQFWDSYAKWYKLWVEHTDYHDRAIQMLMTMLKPGWKVLDIGAGNGILSLSYEIISSFAYHHLTEVMEHWEFKKGGRLHPSEISDIKSKLSFRDGHMWFDEKAYMGMYWWRKI